MGPHDLIRDIRCAHTIEIFSIVKTKIELLFFSPPGKMDDLRDHPTKENKQAQKETPSAFSVCGTWDF